MTQDIGTAIQRSKDMPDVGGMVYTVGNEQDYHFKVLFLILKEIRIFLGRTIASFKLRNGRFTFWKNEIS